MPLSSVDLRTGHKGLRTGHLCFLLHTNHFISFDLGFGVFNYGQQCVQRDISCSQVSCLTRGTVGGLRTGHKKGTPKWGSPYPQP